MSCLKSFQGICVMMPAPSPESASAEQAPRCSMHPRDVRACTQRWSCPENSTCPYSQEEDASSKAAAAGNGMQQLLWPRAVGSAEQQDMVIAGA